MKNTKWFLIIAGLLFLLVLFNLYYSMRSSKTQLDPNDRTRENVQEKHERVKDQAERQRMKAYLTEYRKDQVILKTIVGPSGDTIDFIDLYSQRALKKHKISREQVELRPKTAPAATKNDSGSVVRDYFKGNMLYELTGETCPAGAIPIRRLNMETLTRFETLEDFFRKSHGRIEPPCGSDGGSAGTHEYAHASRSVGNWGAESIMNVWDPYVEQADEFSLSQMWVVRGSGGDRETVEAGWQAYRDLYGDWGPHLFIYFTPDNYGDGGGYNLESGDFVQVNNTVYITGGFTHHSSNGGDQWEFKLMLYKDGTNGAWWLKYGDTWVGYWPRSLFDANGLRDQGSIVDFGGEIVNTQTDGRHTRTDMGSGHWPSEGFGHAAYQRNVQYIDTNNFYQRATSLNASRTNRNCYDINLVESSGSWQVFFFFGGSGFNTSCP